MRTILILAVILIASLRQASAQLITFNEYPSWTTIENQYLSKGITFEGYNGGGSPVIYDYADYNFGGLTLPYGRALHGGGWVDPIRMNFVDSTNPNKYNLATVVEFSNIIDSVISQNDEVDYMSINAYDSNNVLIYHYLSRSPEHVVINMGTPSIAYIVLDDSASTSIMLDNVRINSPKHTSIKSENKIDSKVFPNPFSDELSIKLPNSLNAEITIFDILSREVFKGSFNSSIKVDTENFQSGTYFYQVIDEKGSVSKGKVIKK